jgi:predicted nucleic acid-binding protein
MANRYALNQINTIAERKVFFDANVLIYLFWPSGFYRWENYYSSAFASLLRQQNELCVDFLVISEIVNRAHRIEYDKHLQQNGLTKHNLTYKAYRDSTDGQDALSDIYMVVNDNILNHFSVVGRSFTKADIQSFLTVESLDFVDKAILTTCTENECILCTNDKDYSGADIDILTSNPAILNNQ